MDFIIIFLYCIILIITFIAVFIVCPIGLVNLLIKFSEKEDKDLGPLYDENGSLEMREEIDNFYTYLDDEDSDSDDDADDFCD